jgi:Fe-S oxidoreductase
MRRRLSLVEPFAKQHAYCAHCPKLCRFSCPVSNAESRETTTPWAKMTSLHHVAEQNAAMSEDIAASWYGCTGCMRCRTHCTHRNEVSTVLGAARAEAVHAGMAPPAAMDSIAQHGRREEKAVRSAAKLFAEAPSTSQVGYLPGCTAARLRSEEAVAGWRATEALLGTPVHVEASGCCGLPLLEAGSVERYAEAARSLLRKLERVQTAVFLDPGCLFAMKTFARQEGKARDAQRMLHLSELAARHIDRVHPLPGLGGARYHDPCRLGRGLGIYEAPRRVLAKILGQAPWEFHHRREDSICSGGGGQLPRTAPETAAAIARERLDEHEWVGGGAIVTACPVSARQFCENGADHVHSFAVLLEESCRNAS